MNLLQLTNKIKEAADLHPLVNQVDDGSIYEALNTGDVRYPISVVFSQSVVKEVRTIRYKYVLYFVDRLVGDNALEIQTTAISVIQQIINTIDNNVENISIATGYSIQPFTEKFADECAGAFVQFDIVSENVLGNCSYDEGGDQPILDSYVRKDEVKQSVIEGETLPISSGAVFTALQGISVDVEAVDVSYDNTKTGLPATTAQDAIDQLYEIAIDDPAFKAWLNTNAVYLAILLNEQPTNPENKYLNALRQWVEVAIGGAGYEAPLYYTNINSATHIIGSDTLFYKKISYQPELGETPLTTQSKDNVRTLVGTYLYDAQIATTTIDSGNFGFKLRCKVNINQGTNVLEYVPFLYHIDGTRTDLFTCVSDPIINTTFLDNFKQFPSDTIHCVATDRLGVDVYFKSSSNAFKTLDALIGDGHPSYMVTPLRFRHDGLRDLNGNPNFLHVTQAEKDDFGIKAYAYERVNIAHTIALKLATQTAIIETLTSADAFEITLPTPRLNKVNESIITFKIDQSLPSITFPMVAGWNTDEFVLSADRTRTIVFQQITFDGVNWETWASCDRNS